MRVPHFPREALPGLLRDLLIERSDNPKDDAVAASVIEALTALLASGLAEYEKPEGGTAPLSSYGILLGSSGIGKSFHYAPLVAPIEAWSNANMERNAISEILQKADHLIWRKQVAQLGKVVQLCIANCLPTDGFRTALADVYDREPKPPEVQSLMQDDTSIAAMLRSLATWPLSGWVVDEGALALSMLRNKDFHTLASLWAGKTIQHQRVGEPRREIKGYLSLLFMVQPDIFRPYLKKKGEQFKGSGFAARALYYPTLDEWVGAEDPGYAIRGAAYGKYVSLVDAMLDEINARIKSKHASVRTVAFDNRAAGQLLLIQKESQRNMSDRKNAYARDFLAKFSTHIARMAAKNHVFLGREGEVSVELVEMAEQVCLYHLDGYRWVHEPVIEEPQKVRDAFALLDLLNERGASGVFYRHFDKVALLLGITTTRVRSAVGELCVQQRARFAMLDGKYYVTILPLNDVRHRNALILGDE